MHHKFLGPRPKCERLRTGLGSSTIAGWRRAGVEKLCSKDDITMRELRKNLRQSIFLQTIFGQTVALLALALVGISLVQTAIAQDRPYRPDRQDRSDRPEQDDPPSRVARIRYPQG